MNSAAYARHFDAISICNAIYLFLYIKVVGPLRASSTMYYAIVVAHTFTDSQPLLFVLCVFFCSLIQNQMGFTKNNGFNTRLLGVFVCLKPFCTRDQWLLKPRKNNNCCDNNKDDMENNIIITIPNSNW